MCKVVLGVLIQKIHVVVPYTCDLCHCRRFIVSWFQTICLINQRNILLHFKFVLTEVLKLKRLLLLCYFCHCFFVTHLLSLLAHKMSAFLCVSNTRFTRCFLHIVCGGSFSWMSLPGLLFLQCALCCAAEFEF